MAFFVKQKGVKVYPDGREVCDLYSVAGKREYARRIQAMVTRQRGICCLHGYAPDCPGRFGGDRQTFEHENGRGMGGAHRDDRIELPDGTWINGASHYACNVWKGSRRIPYNVPFNSFAKGLRA